MKPGLAALLSPIGMSEFIKNHWPGETFVTHDLRLDLLTQLPGLNSLDTLFKMWPHSVQAHLPDHSDESSSIDTSAGHARKLFGNGMGLLFNHAEQVMPSLQEWLGAIHRDLGLPTMTHGRCMIYATPHGKGTSPHFDQNINFVLQLHGTKKWWLAPNQNVKNPLQRFTMGGPVESELAAYANLPMPTQMPEDSKPILLKPGSMLFVPRGFWHRTEADGEALALNFTFSQPAWLDLMLAALRSRLSLSEEWRELADGASAVDPARRRVAENRLSLLLMELIDDLPNWQAPDILNATDPLE